MRKYTFQMTKKEIREVCFRIIWEQILLRRLMWILITGFLITECIIFPLFLLVLVPFVLFVAALYIGGIYIALRKMLYGKTRDMWVEEGILKVNAGGEMCGEISCDGITVIRRTRRLLLLGHRAAPKTWGWYPIPLRVFADDREREEFVGFIENPQAQKREEEPECTGRTPQTPGTLSAEEDAAQLSSTAKQEKEYFRRSFQVGKEEWGRMTSNAMEIIQGRTLGVKKGRVIFAVIAALYACFMIWRAPDRETISMVLLFALIYFLVIICRRLKLKPEMLMRMLRFQGRLQNDLWGEWEMAVTEAGVWHSICGKSRVILPWDKILCAVETDTELFFFQKDRKHFVMLLKGREENGDEIETLRALCREKHVEILRKKCRKYVPVWVFIILMVIWMVGIQVALFGMMGGIL